MIETFLNIEHNPSILRLETTEGKQKNKRPPFVDIIREVTEDVEYETWFMAKKDYRMPESDIEAIQKALNPPEGKPEDMMPPVNINVTATK